MDVLSYIMGRSSAKGGGSGDYSEVHFVTFMSEDGSTELYKRPVADGDDCADPVARGYISEPTKESTAQYNYTHVGWSASPNGALDSNILKAVTADKTVYANFAAVLRYYTVNFYDGETLLESQTVAYGITPTIADPQKSGFSFDGWEPAIAAVTGDITYTAKWIEAITFAGGSWEDIVRIAEAGEAQKYFALGDRKTLTYKIGSSEAAPTYSQAVQIVGFNHDDLTDGSGKAAITIMVVEEGVKTNLIEYNSNYGEGWPKCSLRTVANNAVLNSFPEDLKNGIKQVKKTSRRNGQTDHDLYLDSNDYVWIPSVAELGAYPAPGSAVTNVIDGIKYEGLNRSDFSGSLAESITTRSGGYTNTGAFEVDEDNKYWSVPVNNVYSLPFAFGFCI